MFALIGPLGKDLLLVPVLNNDSLHRVVVSSSPDHAEHICKVGHGRVLSYGKHWHVAVPRRMVSCILTDAEGQQYLAARSISPAQ